MNIVHWADIAFVGFSAVCGVRAVCKGWGVIFQIAIYGSLAAALIRLALP